MDNRIRSVRVYDGRLDPAEAEIWVTVRPERLTSTTQVNGRLVGPRSPYTETVEVAYPLREWSREYEKEGFPHLNHRVIIPEPSLWEPKTPFLYQGPVELWQGSQRCEQVQVSHGLRSLYLGPRGLRLNGRPLALRGAVRPQLSEQEARSLHHEDYNTLLVPASTDAALWDLADRFGFLVLVGITDKAQLKEAVHGAQSFRKHACCLGWVVTPGAVAEELSLIAAQSVLSDVHRGQLLGMELKQPPSGPLPEKISFLVCEEGMLPGLAGVNLPKVVRRKRAAGDGRPAGEGAAAGILGWIDE
jgi:Glycosyl hydrolases family 2